MAFVAPKDVGGRAKASVRKTVTSDLTLPCPALGQTHVN